MYIRVYDSNSGIWFVYLLSLDNTREDSAITCYTGSPLILRKASFSYAIDLFSIPIISIILTMISVYHMFFFLIFPGQSGERGAKW